MNLHRRHLNESQEAVCGDTAMPFAEEEAKARKLSTLKRGNKIPDTQKIEYRENRNNGLAVDLGIEMQNNCAEIKIRAERKAGELLGRIERHKKEQGRPKKVLHDERLSDLGISHIQSHRWQRIATIPSQEFEEHIHDVKEQTDGERF